jgi:hypothetical protein
MKSSIIIKLLANCRVFHYKYVEKWVTFPLSSPKPEKTIREYDFIVL